MNKFTIEYNDQATTLNGIEATIDFYRTMAIDEIQLPGLNAFVTGADSPFLNVVIDTNTSNEMSNDRVKSIADFFQTYQVPWAWLVTPVSATKCKTALNNFILLDEYPGMYFDLFNVLPEHSNDQINIIEAQDDLQQWIEPSREGFPSTDNCEGYRILNAELLHKGEKKLRHFVACLQNEVAASGTLFLSNDSVMLHNLSTKNKYKNRGIGTALTLHMMLEAKNLGYRHCFLDASEDAFNLYRRLNFKVYCATLAYQLTTSDNKE